MEADQKNCAGDAITLLCRLFDRPGKAVVLPREWLVERIGEAGLNWLQSRRFASESSVLRSSILAAGLGECDRACHMMIRDTPGEAPVAWCPEQRCPPYPFAEAEMPRLAQVSLHRSLFLTTIARASGLTDLDARDEEQLDHALKPLNGDTVGEARVHTLGEFRVAKHTAIVVWVCGGHQEVGGLMGRLAAATTPGNASLVVLSACPDGPRELTAGTHRVARLHAPDVLDRESLCINRTTLYLATTGEASRHDALCDHPELWLTIRQTDGIPRAEWCGVEMERGGANDRYEEHLVQLFWLAVRRKSDRDEGWLCKDDLELSEAGGDLDALRKFLFAADAKRVGREIANRLAADDLLRESARPGRRRRALKLAIAPSNIDLTGIECGTLSLRIDGRSASGPRRKLQLERVKRLEKMIKAACDEIADSD